MTRRTRIQLGLTAAATAIAAVVSACTAAPLGRTEYCYYYFLPTTTTITTTTTTGPTTTTAAPPTTVLGDGRTYVVDLRCLDQPLTGGITTTAVGYPAPVSAGTRTVK